MLRHIAAAAVLSMAVAQPAQAKKTVLKVASLDVGYHVAYGRHFLDTGHIVELDPFLTPETARPFVNANWGSQVTIPRR